MFGLLLLGCHQCCGHFNSPLLMFQSKFNILKQCWPEIDMIFQMRRDNDEAISLSHTMCWFFFSPDDFPQLIAKILTFHQVDDLPFAVLNFIYPRRQLHSQSPNVSSMIFQKSLQQKCCSALQPLVKVNSTVCARVINENIKQSQSQD